MNKWHITPVFWLLSLPLFGQLNLKAGYCLTLLDAPGYDGVLHTHNTTQTYTSPFEPLGVLHGLDLGFEYRWDAVALEAGWRIKRNRQEASGSNAQRTFANDLNHSLSSFYAGLVQYYGPVRLAASVDYNYTRTKIDFEDPSILTTLKDTGWGSTFSVGYVLGGSGPVSLVFAPYVQVQWTEYDLNALQQVLSDASDPAMPEDYFNYGFTIYFLNGPQ